MSETLQERIIRHEGIKLFPYKDTLGNWTVGVGHCLTKEECDNYPHGISYNEAIVLLTCDIEKATEEIENALPWIINLDDNRKGVLTEMCFQLGLHGLLGFRMMLHACSAGDYALAAKNMISSTWHDQTPDRCQELANIMLTGDIA